MPVMDSLINGSGGNNVDAGFHTIKRGLLWQQRDRLFSRWKERYFVLTRDYLHCFKRATNRTISSDMGHFIFKVSFEHFKFFKYSRLIHNPEEKCRPLASSEAPRRRRLSLSAFQNVD